MPAPPTRAFAAQLASSLVLVLAWLIARLPLSWLQWAGAHAGRLAMRTSPEFRRKTREHLAIAQLPVDELACASAAQVGAAAAETLWIWFSKDDRLRPRLRIEGFEWLERAQAQGRGVMLLTPHLGSFEAAARAVALSCPITVLYKPPRDALGHQLILAGRQRPHLHLAPASAAGVRTLVRALRRGEAIGVLPDQVPSEGEGRWVPFFNRLAYTMTLPERLAALTGALVLMGHAERLPRGQGWIVRIEPLEAGPAPLEVNRAMETIIRRMPAQYFWGYNRYKAPPGVSHPAGTDA